MSHKTKARVSGVCRLYGAASCGPLAVGHPDRKVFLSPDYKEEQLRFEYLNPLFEPLGWGVDKSPETTQV